MIILDPSFTSTEMARFCADSRTPVLDNDGARRSPLADRLALLPGDEFVRRLDAGARLYTTSENALAWVLDHVHNPILRRGIAVMKDKYTLRQTLAPLYPDYRFQAVDADGLERLDPATLRLPVVLKPAVGFFSVGVYMIASLDDWCAALAGIRATRESWRTAYPDSVVGGGRFIIEEYITGDEYAVDAYFDQDGKAVIVDILRHEFSSAADVSDRLYYTSPEIIRERLEEFTDYLDRVGAILGLRDFPLHMEVRLSPSGIIPIEFNPLRFAGWCTTDIAWFAYGIHTYGYYLDNRRPDWDAVLAGRKDNIYSLVILDKASAGAARGFDWDKLEASFTEVLSRRALESGAPAWGFLFARTPASRREELEHIKHSDLREYLSY